MSNKTNPPISKSTSTPNNSYQNPPTSQQNVPHAHQSPSYSYQNTRHQNSPYYYQNAPYSYQNPYAYSNPYAYQNPPYSGPYTYQNPLYTPYVPVNPPGYNPPPPPSHSTLPNSHHAPTYSHEAPAYSHDAPAFSHEAPAYSHEAPAYSNEPPAYSHEPSAYSHEASAYSHEASPYSFEAPIHTPENPIYSHEAPTYPHEASIYSHEAPGYSHELPVYSDEVPFFSNEDPFYSHEDPFYSHEDPYYSHEAPLYSHEAPPYPLELPSYEFITHSYQVPTHTKYQKKPSPPKQPSKSVDREKVYQWILDLQQPESREKAILELSTYQREIPDLAPMLYFSFGTLTVLLNEIVNIYASINPPTLNSRQSNRVCNTLALMQCMASHPETRMQFLATRIPLFLYPFIHTASKTRPFEYLRLTSLAVIGALLKADDTEVVTFMLTTEIVPLCLKIMDSGYELCKIVATFILRKILANDDGLFYVCNTYDRFNNVAMILGKMILVLAKKPSIRLLKYVVECYFRLCDDPRAREAFKEGLPIELRDVTFKVLRDELLQDRISDLINKIDDPELPTTSYSKKLFG